MQTKYTPVCQRIQFILSSCLNFAIVKRICRNYNYGEKSEPNQVNFTYNNFLKPKVLVKNDLLPLPHLFDQILLILLEVYCYFKFLLYYHFDRALTSIYRWQMEMKILHFIDVAEKKSVFLYFLSFFRPTTFGDVLHLGPRRPQP